MLKLKEVFTLLKYGLKERFDESFLGVLWVLFLPMLMFLIHYFVFKNILNEESNYLSYIVIGFFPWHFYKISHDIGVSSFVYKLRAIRGASCHHRSFVMASVLENTFVTFILWLPLLIFTYSNWSTFKVIQVVFSFVIFNIFTFSSVYLLAILQVFYRDIKNIFELVSRVLFFTAPILYRVEKLGSWAWVSTYNPLAIALRPIYSALEGTGGEYNHTIAMSVILSVVILIIAFGVEKKLINKVHCCEI